MGRKCPFLHWKCLYVKWKCLLVCRKCLLWDRKCLPGGCERLLVLRCRKVLPAPRGSLNGPAQGACTEVALTEAHFRYNTRERRRSEGGEPRVLSRACGKYPGRTGCAHHGCDPLRLHRAALCRGSHRPARSLHRVPRHIAQAHFGLNKGAGRINRILPNALVFPPGAAPVQ